MQLLHLRLPVKLGVISQHLPRLLDADQALSGVRRIGRVRDIGEDELYEIGRGLDVCRIGVGDVEDVRAGEARFDCEAESLGAVAGVDVAEAAGVSMGSCRVFTVGFGAASFPPLDIWSTFTDS